MLVVIVLYISGQSVYMVTAYHRSVFVSGRSMFAWSLHVVLYMLVVVSSQWSVCVSVRYPFVSGSVNVMSNAMQFVPVFRTADSCMPRNPPQSGSALKAAHITCVWLFIIWNIFSWPCKLWEYIDAELGSRIKTFRSC